MASTWHEPGESSANSRRAGSSASTGHGATFSRSTGPLHAARLVGEALGEAIETLLTWQARGRTRRDLASLNDYMLHDIGATRADVEREYRKPFWRT